MRFPPLSIRVKLPLLIGALVLAVAGSFAWSAYRGVSEASLFTASDRLGSVTTQIAGLLETSATQLLTNARAVADSPAIRAFLQAPTPRLRAAALAAMNEVYARHFGKHKPARSTVQAARLPRDARVEIDAIAVKA